MTSVTVIDIPCTAAKDYLLGGVSTQNRLVRRRVMIVIVGTSSGASHVDTLDSWVPNLTDIEGVVYSTLDGADKTTATPNTWSTVDLTYANHAGSGGQEVCLIGRQL